MTAPLVSVNAETCRCFEKVNLHLATFNTQLMFDLLHSPARAMVGTCKLHEKQRGKPKLVEASYCPFCGAKYGERS